MGLSTRDLGIHVAPLLTPRARALLRGIDARSMRATWLVWQRRTAQADRMHREALGLSARAARL